MQDSRTPPPNASSQPTPPPNPNPFPNQDPYQNGHQHPYQAPPPNDGFAITSMVLGIIAVITCYFGISLGIIAVIFGHISLSKMKRNPQLSGKGMAIAGLATGYVAIAISVLFGISMMMAGSAGKGFFEEVKKEMKKQEIEQERIRAEEQGRIDAEQENDQSRERIPDQQ